MFISVVSRTFIGNISHCKKNLTKYCHKREKVFCIKNQLFYSDFNEIESESQIFEKVQVSSLVKIALVRAEVFHADRRTDGWT